MWSHCGSYWQYHAMSYNVMPCHSIPNAKYQMTCHVMPCHVMVRKHVWRLSNNGIVGVGQGLCKNKWTWHDMVNVKCHAMVRKVVQIWGWAIRWEGMSKGCVRIKCHAMPFHFIPCHVMPYFALTCLVNWQLYKGCMIGQEWACVIVGQGLHKNKRVTAEMGRE